MTLGRAPCHWAELRLLVVRSVFCMPVCPPIGEEWDGISSFDLTAHLMPKKSQSTLKYISMYVLHTHTHIYNYKNYKNYTSINYKCNEVYFRFIMILRRLLTSQCEFWCILPQVLPLGFVIVAGVWPCREKSINFFELLFQIYKRQSYIISSLVQFTVRNKPSRLHWQTLPACSDHIYTMSQR